MNKILSKIKEMVEENIEKYLPNVKNSELEEEGKIYYMNDRNGTIFDYSINNHLSPFMCFYDDENNMGAVKFLLYADGEIAIYLYENNSEKVYKEIYDKVDFTSEEILELAVIMNKVADEKEKWGAAIEDMNTDIEVTKQDIEEFNSDE